MRSRWPFRLIPLVSALLLASWLIGPPRDLETSRMALVKQSRAMDLTSRPSTTRASQLKANDSASAIEQQLREATNADQVLALLPSACLVDVDQIQLTAFESLDSAEQGSSDEQTWSASTSNPSNVSSEKKSNPPLARYSRVGNKTSPETPPHPSLHMTRDQPSARPASAIAGPRQDDQGFERSPSDRRGIEQLPPTQPNRLPANTHQQPAFPYAPHSVGKTSNQPAIPGEDPHSEVYSRSCYPSATECATCHQQIFDEWAISNHAYAAVSPMFHRFEQKINTLAQGTIGYFCIRCHAPVAVTMGLRRDQPVWDGPRVFREGVTCVVCHRVKEQYSKVNGERRMEPGDLSQPVYGSGDGAGVAKAIENQDYYKVKPYVDVRGPGQTIHRQAIQFEQLSRSDFCASCHQVAVDPGIKLEVVWDQYRASPACREGITCQDCHMGRVPGVAAGYSIGPTAVISNRIVNPAKKHSNHVFFGPGASIAHPGIFPHNPKADRWTFNEWLCFDWRAGWGTDDFEDRVERGEIYVEFPPVWSNVDDRYDARDILNENFKRLAYKNELRRQVMENGSKVDGPFFAQQPMRGQDLSFYYVVTNTNPGHNLPSGSLGAQPQVWLNVVLIGPNGRRLFESGHLDSNGDVADLHSHDVQQGRIPNDAQLFNLQTKFLTTNVKGTDREMYLPINVDFDQLPFIRPGAQPISVMNHPPFIRMEAHSLPPLGSRKAKYYVPGNCLTQPGVYRLSVRIRSRAEPIYFMDFVESTPEMKRAMIESILDVHTYSVEFHVP